MIFVDEAGFYVLPAVVRTYAPRGQTPVLKAPLLYEHLSAISGITAEGRLLMRVQDRSIPRMSCVFCVIFSSTSTAS